MLLKNISSLNFCYTFKGSSYYASKKLTKFTDELLIDEPLLQDLEKHRFNLPDLTKQTLNNLVDSIFIQNK